MRERTEIIGPFCGSPRRVSAWAARVLAGITLLVLVMTAPGCRRRERASPARPGVLLGWAVEHAPIVGQFVGDSADDVIGVTQEMTQVWRKNERRRSVQRTETLRYVDALDGSTLRQAWRIGPFDDDEYKNFHYVRAGQHLVIVDGRGFVDVHAITSGRKIREIDLRGSALDLCAAPDEEGAVWLEMASGSHVLLDPLTGQVRPSGRPAWCPWLEEPCREFRSRARCSPPSLQVAAALAGFHPERVLENEGLRVVIGRSTDPPHWEENCAVGLHVETGRVLWQTKLGDVVPFGTNRHPLIAADLREGRLYLLYSGRGTRLAAVDARTGKEIFDVPLGAFFRGSTLGISPTRIAYHAGGSKVYLLVRDASTGKELVLRDP